MSAKPSIRKRSNSIDNETLVIPNAQIEKSENEDEKYSSEFEESSGGSEVEEFLSNGVADNEVPAALFFKLV